MVPSRRPGGDTFHGAGQKTCAAEVSHRLSFFLVDATDKPVIIEVPVVCGGMHGGL